MCFASGSVVGNKCLYLDSSAARGVLSRKGVGRVRHLSCRVLWLQDFVMQKRLLVRAVMGRVHWTQQTSQPNDLAQQGSNLYATSWPSGEETVWKEPMMYETSSDMSQIRDSRATVNHKSIFWSAPWEYWPNFRAVPVPWMRWLSTATSASCCLFTWLLGLVGYLYVVLCPGQAPEKFWFGDCWASFRLQSWRWFLWQWLLKPPESSEYPPWSQEGMIHWLYDRCERRLEKAVVKQDPYTKQISISWPDRASCLACWPTLNQLCRRANQRWYNRCWRTSQTYPAMKNSPTVNMPVAHCHAVNSGHSSGVATAFVYGAAATQLCGCDSRRPKRQWRWSRLLYDYGVGPVDTGVGSLHMVLATQADSPCALPSRMTWKWDL